MDCCEPTKKSQACCPQCNVKGRAVSFVTVSSMLAPEAATSFQEGAWICKELACSVLYYGELGQVALQNQAQVRGGCKETADPLTLCYCFEITRANIEQEIAETGSCAIPGRIASLTREGRCDCERKNPAGVCCLGEIRAAVTTALRSMGKETTGEKQR